MKYLLLLIYLMAISCAAERQTENYKFDSVNPLTLTVANHPHGYGKTSCFNCHLPQNIHQEDRLKDPSFALANPYVIQKGLTSCSGCHGSNGADQ